MTLRERIMKRLFHTGILVTRAMTLGVRAVVCDQEGNIFLVRHTYVSGWHLPGGGVERGETLQQAVKKELQEEGNIVVSARPQLFAIYKNEHASSRDHVALFICKEWCQTSVPAANMEIAETGFFDLSSLPAETTPATRRRLDEVFGGVETGEYW